MKHSISDDLPGKILDFQAGACYDAYTFLGAHPDRENGLDGFRFRVWAPNAKQVCVMGNFNGWDPDAAPMQRDTAGIWSLFLPGVRRYDCYKYAVHTAEGHLLAKADPYAFHAETRPSNASKIYDISGYNWGDQHWLRYRRQTPLYQKPLNIYEMHLGSWRRNAQGEFLSYRMTAEWLVPYVKEMGYTHVEFMPVTEYPLDMSWGYQVTGYFAPTSRYGTPHDFMYLVDQLHQAGVGVILDWVPSHFPKDAFGLYEFDGGPCYEYADPRKGEHYEWGTRVFDYEKNEVRSFLTSSAVYWLQEYHIDGLRVDAVASMLYLDYGRHQSGWIANRNGGRENLEAVSFLRSLNTTVFGLFPDILMIAEESTSWPNITAPTETDELALGFNFKWNMGWMNDALHYQKMDPYFRQFNHNDLTFPLMYAFRENFILPVSHDEVVHMKGSMMGKMPGNDEMKFAGVRAFFLYMMTHPGKKLTMMGTEFGQFNEWHYEYSLDWHLLEYPPHQAQQRFFRQLNAFYLSHSQLWELDGNWDGFEWIEPDDPSGNTIIYLRRNLAGDALLIAVNFSPIFRDRYRIGVPDPGCYEVVFSSDSPTFGGQGRENQGILETENIPCHGQAQSLLADLPPLCGVILRCRQKAAIPAAESSPPERE